MEALVILLLVEDKAERELQRSICVRSYSNKQDHHNFAAPTDSEEETNQKGSLVGVLCANSVGQVMERGVMMHQQHQPWVVPPEVAADGTQSIR